MGHRLLVHIMFQHVTSHISAPIGELFRCYAEAVFKRFVIVNNHYFECFQALNFDNLVQSKFYLCKNDNKVRIFNQRNVSLKTRLSRNAIYYQNSRNIGFDWLAPSCVQTSPFTLDILATLQINSCSINKREENI